jgi:hypothetical protein
MTISKQTRHRLYKTALKLYLDLIMEHTYYGLCYMLFNNKDKFTETKNTDAYEDMSPFPEIAKYEPEEFYGYWWELKDTEIRIKVLNEAINETKISTKKSKT